MWIDPPRRRPRQTPPAASSQAAAERLAKLLVLGPYETAARSSEVLALHVQRAGWRACAARV